MRYLSVTDLKEGMVLAHPIYGKKFEVLMVDGSIIGPNHIRRVTDMGFPGVYIDDDLSKDIVVENVIPLELRMRTVQAAKELLLQAESSRVGYMPSRKALSKVTRERQEHVILPVIQALISSRRRLVDAIDLKPYQDYDYYHAANVVVLSLLIGIELGISGNQLYELGLAALLHDVGNAFIPKGILNKPDRLTEIEYEVVKSHSEKGFDYLKENYDISIDACMGALQHHENYDGTGYPNQLRGNKISLCGRILAITTVYDALVSQRPFRRPMMPPAAMEFLRQKSGSMFDPELVETMGKIISLYPAGICVELTTGVRCIVVEGRRENPARPKLRMLDSLSSAPMYIDLCADAAFADTAIAQIIDVV